MNIKILFALATCYCTHFSFSQCLETVYSGDGTYYNYTGGGNCSFPNPYTPQYSAALNAPQYGSSQLCGACAEVTGPLGTLLVSLEDQCPECAYGDLDLEQEAFPHIADPVAGRVDISWKIVACPVSGPVSFHFKEGSSQYWTAVQVRNHRYPINKFEYKNTGGTFVQVPRVNYNYFIEDAGMGVGPYDFRLTDITGQILEFENIPFSKNATVVGDQQFNLCTIASNKIQTEAYEIIVYPNPSADRTKFIFNKEAFSLDIELYDMVGRPISRSTVYSNSKLKIELPDIGTYILRIAGPHGETRFEKLIEY